MTREAKECPMNRNQVENYGLAFGTMIVAAFITTDLDSFQTLLIVIILIQVIQLRFPDRKDKP